MEITVLTFAFIGILAVARAVVLNHRAKSVNS